MYLLLHNLHDCTFKRITNSSLIPAGKSKGLCDKSVKPPPSNLRLASLLNFVSTKIRVIINESCLKQRILTFTYKKVVSIYMVYEANV